VLRRLLAALEAEGAWLGYCWAGVLLACSLASTLLSEQYFRAVFQAGFQMRTALMAALYRKAMRLSPAARQRFTTGEITNLMVIDAHKLVEVMPHINVVWSGPLQICLAVYFLYDLVGVSALAGMAVLLVLLPANLLGETIGRRMESRQMGLKDQRILLMNEILQGIKVIKYYAWEKPFMKKVEGIRQEEVGSIINYHYMLSGLNVTFTVVPLLVTLVTFATYIHIDPVNNIITAEKVFACIAIFNLLRLPLFLFPMFLLNTVRLAVSLGRVRTFLACPELPGPGERGEVGRL
jgi:ABC-type multidrug transport system fused ATPase/permease subunit